MYIFVCNWIELVSPDKGEHFDLTEDTEEVLQCPICFEVGKFGHATHYRRTGCNHDFGLDCLKKCCMKATSCPCCRGEFKDADHSILVEKPQKLAETLCALVESSDKDKDLDSDSDSDSDCFDRICKKL